MPLETWVESVSELNKKILRAVDVTLARTHLETDENETTACVSWSGDAENQTQINTKNSRIEFQPNSENPPKIEYLQSKNRRGFKIRQIKDISIEVERETLEKIATPKGAGIAIVGGAICGLIAWSLAFFASRATLITEEELPMIASGNGDESK